MTAIELPSQLANGSYRLIKLGPSGERLKVPIEIGWNIFNLEKLDLYIQDKQLKWDEAEATGKHEELRASGKFVPRRPAFRGRLNNYAHDEPEFVEWLKRGNNYGVTASGGLDKLESDDIQRWQELGVIDLLPITFTVQSSSPNRQHFYYDGPEVSDSPLKDPVTGEDIGHIRGTGEAGGRGGMVVGPGSLHPHNVRYTVIRDLPIAKISKEALDKIKSILCGKSTPKNDNAKARTTNNDTHQDPFKNVSISDVLGAHCSEFHSDGSQMAGPNSYGSHTNKNEHCLVVESGDKEFYCFECEQGGGVSRLIAIKAGIMRCDEKGAPTGRAWWSTIRYALDEGLIDEATAGGAGLREEHNQNQKTDRSLLDGLAEKMKEDPGIIYEPEYFQALTEIYNTDPKEWVRIKKIFLTRKVSVRDFVNEIKEAEEDTPIIETPFIELEGGKLAEMVANNGTARFAVYDPVSKTVEYVSEILQDGTRILPPASDEIFTKGYVTLPTEAEEYGTELELYQEIKTFVHAYLEVSPDYESIAAFYPMLTWVHDVMPVIAYLRAKGDWGVGKSRYLDVFRALCYRSISTTGAMSEAPIFRIMDRWKGTLIIDEGDFGKSRDSTAAMEKILVCGFERGKPIIRCNPNDPAEVNFFDPFGPKIIATRYGFRDKALESRCFTEIMKESIRIDVPIQLPFEFEEEARHLRNKLLMYRFRNRELVKQTSEKGTIEIDLSGLPKRIQQAARPLSVILANYPELLATLKAFLVVKSKALVMEASETTEGYLVRVMENEHQLKNDGKIITWDAGFGGITELIKATSGNYKLTTALVRSRANSLGFKTDKSMIAGEQKRRITCEVPLFERLKKRYIPQVDSVDDLDDAQGRPDKTLSTQGEVDEDDKSVREREFSSGGDIDRPDRPHRPAQASPLVVEKKGVFEETGEPARMGKIERETPAHKEADPDRERFKAGMKKRHCLMCGQNFSYDLGIHWQNGYICAKCHREGPPPEPAKPDSQTPTQAKLGSDEAKA